MNATEQFPFRGIHKDWGTGTVTGTESDGHNKRCPIFIDDNGGRHRSGWTKIEPLENSRHELQVLTIDIETAPNLAHVWGLWNQNVAPKQLLESTEVLCWAAKWRHETEVMFKSVHHDGRDEMINEVWNLLNRAHAVVHYNGRSFDVPHLNREFVRAGYVPPSPYKQIDLYIACKKNFAFPSHRLAYIGPSLELGDKTEHEGHELWLKCMAGDSAAWGRMREYNIQDVVLTEKLYERILPWIPGHPSYGALLAEDVCPTCGSDDLALNGFAYTKTGKFRQYRCKDCGKHSRSTRRVSSTGVTESV